MAIEQRNKQDCDADYRGKGPTVTPASPSDEDRVSDTLALDPFNMLCHNEIETKVVEKRREFLFSSMFVRD